MRRPSILIVGGARSAIAWLIAVVVGALVPGTTVPNRGAARAQARQLGVAFVRERPESTAAIPGVIFSEPAIWRVGVDGRGQRLLVPHAGDVAADRAGRRLALVRPLRIYGAANPGAGLFVRDLRTGRERRVGPSVWAIEQPALSPDGRRLAFVRRQAAPGSSPTVGEDTIEVLYTVGANDRGLRRVGRGSAPAWAPDGRRLAVVVAGCLVVIRPDGVSIRLRCGHGVNTPSWSPGGTLIAYSRLTRRGWFGDASDLFVIRPDGRDSRQLTHNHSLSSSQARQPYCQRHHHSAGQPAWSPGGRSLAYASDDGLHILSWRTGRDRIVSGVCDEGWVRWAARPAWVAAAGSR